MKFFKKAKRGFTLVELVVVIAVIAILAAVSVGAYFGVTESANKSKLEQEGKQFHTAIQTVALRNDTNHSLNADGLRVVSLEDFDTALTGVMGQEVEVMDMDPKVVSKPTIVLNNTSVKEQSNGTLYKTFDYYTPEIGGKKIAIDVVTGDFKHYNNIDFEINTEDETEVTYYNFYFENNWKWNDPAVYFWGSDKVADMNMPGVLLTEVVGQSGEGDDIYAVKIPTDAKGFLFNGGGEQSVDLTIPAEGISSDTCYYMLWNGTTNTKECPTYTYPPIEEEPGEEVQVTRVKIYYDNLEGWESVYVHYWGGTESTSFPGEAMTKGEEDIYWTFEIDSTSTGILFNCGDNSKQTTDFTFDATKPFYVNGVWDSVAHEHIYDENTHLCGCGKKDPSYVEPTYLYLKPNSNWISDNARFATYFFGDGDQWVDMIDSDSDGIYEVQVPTNKNYTSFIFCRMNPTVETNNWESKYNQTYDLSFREDDKNTFVIPKGGWDCGKNIDSNWYTLEDAKSHNYPENSLPSIIYVDFANKFTTTYYGVWLFNGTAGDKFEALTDSDSDGIYEVDLGSNHGYKGIIFVEFKSSSMDWSNKKTQSGDLTIQDNGQNLFVFNDGDGYWTVFES